jgi:ketosteroid isomerase-like protein
MTPQTDTTTAPGGREALEAFLHRLGSGDLAGVAALLADYIDWEIPGSPAVPWTGKRTSPHGVEQTLTTLTGALTPEEFTVSAIVDGGADAVAVGRFTQRVNATGATFTSDFAIHITAGDDGKITRYRIHEDSYAVARVVAGS